MRELGWKDVRIRQKDQQANKRPRARTIFDDQEVLAFHIAVAHASQYKTSHGVLVTDYGNQLAGVVCSHLREGRQRVTSVDAKLLFELHETAGLGRK